MSDTAPHAAPEPTDGASLRVERDLSKVAPAVDALCKWLRTRGVGSDEALAELELAVTEALTNSIRHGDARATDPTTLFAWSWRSGELEIEVSEPGRYEPPEHWARLPEDPLAEGGRGGFLITELMDAAEHHNVEGRHVLRLRRRL
jgi:anti-sigma regulatory factor (Ser/Thr protein kinase)